MLMKPFILQYQDEDVKDIFSAVEFTCEESDIYEKYKVETYLNAYGLCVNRAYRGRSVATEMLRARIPLLKSLGLKVTATAFTTCNSQKAAKTVGFRDAFVIR